MLGRVASARVRAGWRLSAVCAAAMSVSSCGVLDIFGSADKPLAVNETPVVSAKLEIPWPTHGWVLSSPEAQGIDSAALVSALETIRAKHIPVNSLLIERHGHIVLDAYFYPYTEDRAHDVFSVTKSVTSTLVGIAMADRKLDRLDAPLETLLPAANSGRDPRKAHITLANLLSMTSGLDCSDAGGRNFLQQMEASRHWTDYAFSRPTFADPGTAFSYCAGNMHLVSAVLSRATGESAADYAREKLFAPLGIEDASWPRDADGISYGFADLKLGPRDMAKLGYLWLHRGEWDGKQIVPAGYLADAVSPHASVEPNVEYGYGIWLYPERGHAGGPADFEANGAGGQRIAVIPSQDIVEVVTGTGLDANDVASLLADAVKSESPLTENPLAYARLQAKVAEAESGTTTIVASVVPMPKPSSDTVAPSAPALTAALAAATLPKPRPSS